MQHIEAMILTQRSAKSKAKRAAAMKQLKHSAGAEETKQEEAGGARSSAIVGRRLGPNSSDDYLDSDEEAAVNERDSH